MQNELKYQVRSREIGDLVSMMRNGRLVISPYFQRNLVWRDAHKRDFIDTILNGYPFPQIFLARGPINLTTMESQTCVVDGQQRLNAIRDYLSNDILVNGKSFSQLTTEQKTAFIKYEVPVIDFDLDAGDARLKDVFKRLNRTFYSLSSIERIATEYSSSDFLLIARVLCGDIASAEESTDEAEVAADLEEPPFNLDSHNLQPFFDEFVRDPGISEEKWKILLSKADGEFSNLLNNSRIFSYYEFQRKVPLMFVLNVMCTILGGYYSRNSKVKDYLEDYTSNFDQADEVVARLNDVAAVISAITLDDSSMWWNKANFFTMVCELAKLSDINLIDTVATYESLVAFQVSTPKTYAAAAREAVNNKPERVLRASFFQALLKFKEGPAMIMAEDEILRPLLFQTIHN